MPSNVFNKTKKRGLNTKTNLKFDDKDTISIIMDLADPKPEIKRYEQIDNNGIATKMNRYIISGIGNTIYSCLAIGDSQEHDKNKLCNLLIKLLNIVVL